MISVLANISFLQFRAQLRQILFSNLPAPFARLFIFQREAKLLNLSERFEQELNDYKIDINFDLIIELTNNITLQRYFEIPKVSSQDIKRLIQVEAERILPIHVSKLAITWQIHHIDNDKKLGVTLVAIRQSVLSYIEKHISAMSLPVQKVYVKDCFSEQDIVFKLSSLRNKTWLLRGMIGLGLLTISYIISLVPSFYLTRMEGALFDIDSAILETRSATANIATLQNQIRTMQSLASSVHLERTQGLIVDTIGNLSEASPDNIIIHELRLDGERLYLSGQAKAPEAWVLSLAEHEAFEDVALSSVMQQQNIEEQRFEVRATIIWPVERGS